MTRLMIPPSDEPEIADEILSTLHKVCTELDITFFLHAGTVLGFIREGDYLPKDNDIDVGVVDMDGGKTKRFLIAMEDAGFIVDELMGGIKAHFWRDNMLLDVRGLQGQWGGERLVTECLIPYIELFDKVEHAGIIFNIPHPHNEYLTCCYGPNWRVPKPKASTVVFAPVCCDILHIGHIRWLQEATNHGDYLVIGLCTDEFVEQYKGQRPIIPYEQRKYILQALRCVDFVEPFRAFNDYEAITKHNVKVYVVDNEFPQYEGEHEAQQELQGRGIRYVTIARTPEISTTLIKEKCCDSLLDSDPDFNHRWWVDFYKDWARR